MNETILSTIGNILLRVAIAAVIGGVIGYERRLYHKAIGVAGMMLVAIGSCTYMLLAQHEVGNDPAAISRTLQGLLAGIGFLGGAVIYKTGTTVRGIKAAAAVWITGAIGMSIGTSDWWLGVTVGILTAGILFVADVFPDPVRAEQAGDQVDVAPGGEPNIRRVQSSSK
jgi:putative Mg2+ transporter-C (MgtC) family protein